MIGFLRRLFRRKPRVELRTIADDESERNRQRVIMEAFRTGKPVVGNYDEDGKFVMRVIDGGKK